MFKEIPIGTNLHRQPVHFWVIPTSKVPIGVVLHGSVHLRGKLATVVPLEFDIYFK
jgi:hypothetical protein